LGVNAEELLHFLLGRIEPLLRDPRQAHPFLEEA